MCTSDCMGSWTNCRLVRSESPRHADAAVWGSVLAPSMLNIFKSGGDMVKIGSMHPTRLLTRMGQGMD